MFPQKLCLVVITGTLLLQCCFADESLSTVKTSSGRSLYLNAESQNSNTEITSDSFSKSDSSFAASQSEVSQNNSSVVNTGDGISIQDSSYHSSNSNISESNSNTVASDGFISQTDSNFTASSSTTAESDSSIITTPDSTVMSTTESSSTSTASSSSVTSSSVNGQMLDINEADISFPDDFSPGPISSPYETKSLDSIPDFNSNSLEPSPFPSSPNSKFPSSLGSKPFPDFPNSKIPPLGSKPFPDFPNSSFPSSLGSKPFPGSPNSKFPPSFTKFPNSLTNNSFKKPGPKGPYSPAGSFNSKPTPKIGTPVGPAGISDSFLPHAGDNLPKSLDISEPFPSTSDSPINSLMNSGLDEQLPSNSLPNNPFPNNDISSPEPFQQPLSTPNFPEYPLDNSPLNSPNPLSLDSLPNNQFPNNDFSSPEPLQQPLLTNPISAPYSSTDYPSDNSPFNSSNDIPTLSKDLNSANSFQPSLTGDNIPQPNTSDLLHDDFVSNSIPSLSPISPITSSDLSNSSNDQQPLLYNTQDSILDHYSSPDMPNPSNGDEIFDSPLQTFNSHEHLMKSPENDFPTEFHPDMPGQIPELQGSPTDLHPSSPYDSFVNSSENDISTDFHPDMSQDSSTDLYPSSPHDSFMDSPGNDIPIELYPDMSSQIPESQNYSTNLHPFSPHDSFANSINETPKDYLSDSPIIPGPQSSSTDLSSNTNFPVEEHSSMYDTPIAPSYDSPSDDFHDSDSPFAQFQSQQPYDILKDSPVYGEDISTPATPYDSTLHSDDLTSSLTDYNSTPTLESMDTNQDGFISPEEILESNSPSSPTPFSPIDNIEQPTIPDSAYLSQPEYDDSLNLSENKELLKPDQFLPNDQTPLEQSMPQLPTSGYNYPQKPEFPPYDQLPGPNTFEPKPKPTPTYSGFNKPLLGYPGNEYPSPSTNDFSSPRKGPQFPKYPPGSPYFRNDVSNYPPMPFAPLYPSPYGTPMMPSPYDYPINNPLFYDYPRNLFQPPPLLNHPLKPGFYSTSPPFIPANPLLNRPFYPGGSPFDSLQRPPYIPKDWSKIPVSRKLQPSPNLLSPSYSPNLDYTQPSLDSPSSSLLPQSPFDSSIPDSSVIQPSLSSDLNSDLPFINPDSSTSYNSPFATPDLSPTSLNLQDDSPFGMPDSSSFSSLDLNTNSPSAISDLPSTPLTPNSIDDEIFGILKQQYESTTAEYQLSNSIYPRNISPNFDTMTDEELTFNFVVLGSSPAALSALKTLSDTGKSILLIERGDLPPHISKSLYYRPTILQSDYVRRIKSSAPHCDVEKVLYVPNVLGEESTYNSNIWDYGVKSKYIKWGKLCKKWTWNNVVEYFTDGSDKPYTCAIPVTTEIENTKAVNAVTSIFNDAGLYRTNYEKGKRLEGLTAVPYLQENGENIILAEKIFQQLTSYTNIQLALGTTPESIVFDNVGKAIGVIVKTPCGITKTISILDELIIGSNPVDTVQFLYQSGIGDHEKLQQLNIPTQINLPYVGKELIITPLHFGVIYLFPQGTLLSDNESDFVAKDYLFGKYGLPSALSVDYLKAALNIYESREANVIFNFRVFSKSMSERLNSYVKRLTHIDAKIEEYLTNLCQEYDLLLAVPQLTNVLSRGEIMIANSSGQFEVLVDTGMYKSKRDITIMQKALKVLKSIAETETFKSMNGKAVQIPVEQCGVPDFSTEYNRCSIRYLSLPNLHFCGGTIMGVSPLTSVVNEDLLVHGTKNVRIFSASVVPYGTSTDSSAVSSMVGNLGAHILFQNYLQ